MRNLSLTGVLLLSATSWAAQEQPYEPDEHTALLLHFDEREGRSAADASASRLKPELLSAPREPLWEPDGMFGGCLRFDGINEDKDGDGRGDGDALWSRDEGVLQPGDGLTVEAWVKPDRLEGSQSIVSRAGGGRYCLFLRGRSVYFSMQMQGPTASSWRRLLTPGLLVTGKWQHLAVTYDGKTIRGYLNGREVAEAAAAGTPTTGKAITVIGCDTDSRPLPSAIRSFKGLIDELRISNVARERFNVSEERTAAVEVPRSMSSSRNPASGPQLPDRPKYPDPPVPELNERRAVATGRVLAEGGKPLPGVLVSDGEHVVRTDEQGAYRLEFDVKDLQFVFATRPRGLRPVGSFYVPIKRDGTETEYQRDFVFALDPLADRERFTFLASGDSQFAELLTYTHLLAEYAHLTQMSGDPGFFTMAGDLTMVGTQWEMDLYKDVCKQSRIPLYNCFGGHDGNYSRKALGRGSVYNYQKNLGPAWYSWDYGPAHFSTYVSETYFLSEGELARQNAWFQADLDAQPKGKPIVLITHQPPSNAAMEGWLEKYNIIGLIYGHWHLVNACGYKHVPYLDTTPMRGRDWGAFTRSFRVVTFADGKLETEVRVCAQVQRLEIVSPRGTVGRGRVPVQVKAYDTIRRVKDVACEIEAGGKRHKVALAQNGAWTWSGSWDASAIAPGKLTIRTKATDEDGRTWGKTGAVVLAETPRPEATLAGDWPGFFREGCSRVAAGPLGTPIELAWVANTGGRNQKAVTPIAYDGKVYVGIDNKEAGHPDAGVACYGATTGEQLWRGAMDSSVCFAPAARDGVVYAVGSLGTCYAFDAQTGAEKWRTQPFGVPSGHRLVQCCPVLHEDELVVVTNGQGAVLDVKTGQTRRTLALGSGLMRFSFPSINEGRIYGGFRKLATARDFKTGDKVWDTAIASGKISSTPVPYRGKLYINAAALSCLDEKTGEKLWQQSVPTSGNGLSIAVPAGDLVLGNGTYLKAFDADTGTPRWQYEYVYDADTAKVSQRQVYAGQSTPAVAGDTVYVGSDDGHLHAFKLTDGTLLWRYSLGVPIKGSPVISGNALFVCDWDGNLYCFVGR